MTAFLASVTGRLEAEIALAGGADIIDLKNPSDGALGAAAQGDIRETISFVGGRRPVSAVCGNLPMEPEIVRRAAEEMAATGVDYLKVGFLPDERTHKCVRSVAPLAGRVKIVAVLFADSHPDFDLLPALGESGFYGAMLDTAGKASGRLLDHMSPYALSGFVGRAKARGLKTGLSGSLEAPDVPRLLPYQPDFLGFRGALCGRAGRASGISLDAVRNIRALIPQEQLANISPGVDYRLLAARGYSPGLVRDDLGVDRIFVRDFVLPVEIGAYSFERGRKQKVRFDVTADVRRATRDPRDMRHVFSYDIIMDAIRAIVASGHVELSETLAEQVASRVLADPRVVRVHVRVEKLELSVGSAGVEIERSRVDEPNRAAVDIRRGEGVQS